MRRSTDDEISGAALDLASDGRTQLDSGKSTAHAATVSKLSFSA
jgi:hypothetical protein